MSNTLEVFGKTWTNVEGIKATDNNGNIVTFESEGERKYTSREIADLSAPAGEISFSCDTIGDYAFFGRTGITAINAPDTTKINQNALNGCNNLITVNVPQATTFGNSAFQNCSKLESISVSENANSFGSSCFYKCSSLENLNVLNLATVPTNFLREAGTGGLLINPLTVNDSGFRDAQNWSITLLPNLKTINGTYVFAGGLSEVRGSTITTLVLPSLTTIASTDAFSYCHGMTSFDIGNLTSIPNYTFRSNFEMDTLILRKDDVTALANIGAFNDTPFASGGSGGTLYVPGNRINEYEQATNWSTILSYANNSIVAIENSQYANTYADGTSFGNGINLLQNSENFDPNFNTFSDSTAVAFDGTEFGDIQAWVASGPRYLNVNFPNNLINGDPYTISFEVYRANISGWGNLPIYIQLENMNYIEIGSTKLGEWVKVYYVFYAQSDIHFAHIKIHNTSSTGVNNHSSAFRHFKLEKGITATTWTEGGTL